MNSNNKLQAVVAGHFCLDITPNFGENGRKSIGSIFSPGKLTNVSGVKLSTGGAVSNTGAALGILGINTKLMGKVGSDYFGDIVLKILEDTGIHGGMTVVEGAQTSYSVVLVLEKTDRIFLHDPGANDTFCADDINYDVVREAQLFHFGYPPIMKRMYEKDGEELIKIFKRVKEMGVTTSLDMCMVDPSSPAGSVDWGKLVLNLLPYVDIFVPSIEEIMFMVERDRYNSLNEISKGQDMIDYIDLNYLPELGKKLLDFGAKVVLIKCGSKGCYLRTGREKALSSMGKAMPLDLGAWSNRELLEETYHVPQVVSATGAGDTTIAAFLASLLNGKGVEESMKIACATGAECVQDYSALGGIKPLEETEAMIKRGWEKNRISIEGSYWRYDDTERVWFGSQDILFNK